MCWDCNDNQGGDPYKIFTQGGVSVDDFYTEFNYQTRLKGRGWSRGGSHKIKAKKSRPGCPGNDYKAHVYVWTSETQDASIFSDYFGFHKYQSNVCAGCGKKNGFKISDEYMKIKERKWAKLATPEKGVPVSRWSWKNRPYISFRYWTWENYDEGYAEARKKYLVQRGYTSYYYGW